MNKAKCLALSLALIFGVIGLVAQTPEWQWAVRAGGAGSDSGYDIAVDSQGNQYITGTFQETAAFGPYTLTSSGLWDIFAAKLDANGNWLWAVRAGGTSIDMGYGIAVDGAGNAYLTGRFYSSSADFGPYTLASSGSFDIFATKLDSNGNWLWAVRAGGTDWHDSNDIAVDGAGNAYLTGYYAGIATFGDYTLPYSANYDIFAAKLDPNGNWLWAVRAGGTSIGDYGQGIAVDGAGNAYLTGEFRSSSAVFGPYTLTSSGGWDILAAKLDTNGNWLWAVRAGGTSSDSGSGIAVDGVGNAYLTGYFEGSAEFSPYTLTSSGNIDIFVATIATTAVFPSSPENLTITRFGNDILLSWDAVTLDTNNQALIPDGYRVYSSSDADPDSFSLLGEATGTSYTHNGATVDLGQHFYRVTAVKD